MERCDTAEDSSAVQLYRQQCQELQSVLSSFKGEDKSLKDGGSSWADVIQSMDTAKETYSHKRGRAKTEDVHANKSTIATLEMLTDMIPDQDGLSVLRGGLKVVFKLVQRRIHNREEILNAFEDIPFVFLRACERLQIHPDDAELRLYVEGLFTTLVEQMPKLVNILLRQHKGSLPSRLFKQHPEHEASIISSCLEAISRASRRVSERTTMLESKAIVENLKETRFIGVKIGEASEGMQLLQQGQAQIDRKLDEHSARAYDEIPSMINIAMNPIYDELQSFRQLLLAAFGDPTRLIQDFQPQQQESIPQLPWHTSQTFPSPVLGLSPTASTEIFHALCLPDPESVNREIYQVLQASNKMRANHGNLPLEQAGYLLLEPRFQLWIQPTNGRTDVILAHGRLGDRTEGKISGLSVVAAMFSAVRHVPHFIVLHHFCGLHARYNHAGSGPIGLVQSLIAQLLVYINGNAGFAVFPEMQDNPQLLEGVAEGDLASLLLFFGLLFHRIASSHVVYCVVDGIDSFEGEQGGWAGQMCDVVDFLHSLAADSDSKGPVMKLLLTAAKRSIKVHSRLDASCHIWLSEDKRLPHTAHHTILKSDLDRAIAL